MLEKYTQIFKVLGDKSRLKIVSSLSKKPMHVELLSERVGLNPSTVSFHLKKLEQLNLVTSKKDQYYVIYQLNQDKLDVNIKDIISKISFDSESLEKKEQEYYDKIVSNFFKYNKLVSIPVQRKKREVILKELAKNFEIGKKYTEKEMNLLISEYHDDFCTLRREFIINKIFTRENGIYTRQK